MQHVTHSHESATGGQFTPSADNPKRFVRLPEVMLLTGRGRTATLDDVKAGTFPRPVKIGAATCWVYGEVMEWIDARIRASRGHTEGGAS